MNSYKKGIIALILANIIWGMASPIFKYSLEGINLFTLAFLRFFIASFLILPFVFNKKKEIRKTLLDYKKIILCGLFATLVNITFFFLALEYTESINAPIIGSSAPILIMILSAYFLKEQLVVKKILGSIISFFGVLVIVLIPVLEKGTTSSVLGNLFLVLATFGAIGHTLLGRDLANKYDSWVITFLIFIIGTISFLPLMLFFGIGNIDINGIIGIIFGSVFSSFFAYSLYSWGLSKIKASEASLFAYLDPVIAVMIAYPLLGEKPTPLFIVGSILVFGGIFLAEKRIHYHPLHKLFQN